MGSAWLLMSGYFDKGKVGVYKTQANKICVALCKQCHSTCQGRLGNGAKIYFAAKGIFLYFSLCFIEKPILALAVAVQCKSHYFKASLIWQLVASQKSFIGFKNGKKKLQ